MILTKAQAVAVNRAMIELNKLPACLHARILPHEGGMTIHVQEFLTDEINVWTGDRPGNPVGDVERYINQAAFRAFYHLESK